MKKRIEGEMQAVFLMRACCILALLLMAEWLGSNACAYQKKTRKTLHSPKHQATQSGKHKQDLTNASEQLRENNQPRLIVQLGHSKAARFDSV